MERYVLKHIFYGQFTKDGKPVGDMRLLAKTNGVSNEAVAEVLQLALIPPRKGTAGASWGIIRGKSETPFILAISGVGKAGQRVLHFALLPSELLRAMGGNLRLFNPIVNTPMPDYDRVGIALEPLAIEDVRPPSESQEIDDILDLMMYTRNRMNVLETLLGAVVKGVPIAVVNAPEDPSQRFTFIAGLLALLPPSVRFAVTFATHTLPKTKIDAQIKFLAAGSTPPENTVIYDWSEGAFYGVPVQENYSRFIVSQLRLDAELVIMQTRRLTTIASWRVKQGDRLANALAYASQRMSMDDAVMNGQPVEVSDVSKMLSEDPTLTDELRIAYAQHLMSFSTALGELEHAEPLGIMLRTNSDLADATHTQLRDAVYRGAAGDAYDLLEKWLLNPLGPQGQRWIDLAQEAATTYFKDMVETGDTREIQLFLQDVDKAGIAVGADYLMPRLIETAQPLAPKDSGLAMRMFVYGCRHMTIEQLATLLRDEGVLTQLPEAVRQYVRAVQNQMPNAHPNLIANAVMAFKGSRRLILVRLVELALFHQHAEDVIDENVLKQLINVTQEDWGNAYFGVLAQAARKLSDEPVLKEMSHTGQRLLLGIFLSIGYYKELANQMKRQSRLLYSVDDQTGYVNMVRRLFAETPLSDAQVPIALETIVNEGIRSLPMVMAFVGVLESRKKPTEATDAVAGDLLDAMEHETGVINVLPVEAIRSLMLYHLRRRDVDGALRCARMFAEVSARYGERTAKAVGQMYRNMGSHPRLKAERIDMLQRYVRHLTPSTARQAIDLLLGTVEPDVKDHLEATYALKVVMGDQDVEMYAQALRTTAQFLEDTAEAYSSRNTPTRGGIHNELDSMPGGLNSEEKESIAGDMLTVGRTVYELGERHKRVRNAQTERRIEELLQAEANPQSAIEVLRVFGGFLSQGKRFSTRLQAQEHPHPLPNRSATTLIQEVATVCYLLNAMLSLEEAEFVASAIHDELENMWQELPLEQQRTIANDFARDLQRVADLVPLLATEGDIRALEDTGLGRRLESNRARPRNTLEFYRFVAGYYLARV